jgi:hypothetical protein
VVTGAAPILGVCRALVTGATPLEAYRGDTLCVRIRSLGQAAELEQSPSAFVRRHSRLRAAPPVESTASAGQPVPRPRALTEELMHDPLDAIAVLEQAQTD